MDMKKTDSINIHILVQRHNIDFNLFYFFASFFLLNFSFYFDFYFRENSYGDSGVTNLRSCIFMLMLQLLLLLLEFLYAHAINGSWTERHLIEPLQKKTTPHCITYTFKIKLNGHEKHCTKTETDTSRWYVRKIELFDIF